MTAASGRSRQSTRRWQGIATNRDFLAAYLEDSDFAAGRVHTGFIKVRRAALAVA